MKIYANKLFKAYNAMATAKLRCNFIYTYTIPTAMARYITISNGDLASVTCKDANTIIEITDIT